LLPAAAMPIAERVGAIIRHWRKRRGFSQEELAHRARLHPTYVSGIQTGYRNPTIAVLERVANALEVDPVVLLKPASSKRDPSR
jgi:transcriptional regulator with XRE-family HTH domain